MSEKSGLVKGRQNTIEEIFSERIPYIFPSFIEAKRFSKVIMMFAYYFQPISAVEERVLRI